MITRKPMAIADGVWPTMLTPYKDNGEVDYYALEAMIEWYIERKVAGLFAVCGSSEMFHLSRQESVDISEFVVKKVDGRVGVVSSGHISVAMSQQIDEINEMAKTGADGIILITNRLALKHESEDVFKNNISRVLDGVKDTPMGFYECPAPTYNKQLTPETLRWAADTGRFVFIKETSGALEIKRAKIEAIKGTDLKYFNAHSASFLETMKMGANGYNGIMANFVPELYVWMFENYAKEPQRAQRLQNFLGFGALNEGFFYTVNAKDLMAMDGVPINIYARTKDHTLYNEHTRMTMKQYKGLANDFIKEYCR